MILEKFLFEKLPLFFKTFDSNKDSNDEGTLERYLSIFGKELDDEAIPLIDNFLNEVDSTTAQSKFLNYISYTLGTPPDILKSEPIYRRILTFIVSVYKIKGTKKAYELFFKILGFNAQIIEHPLPPIYLYDNQHAMDDIARFDFGACITCSDYSIILENVNGNCLIPTSYNISPTTLLQIKQSIAFNEPVNAKLRSVTVIAKACENVEVGATEGLVSNLYQLTRYDNSLLFDNANTFDEVSSTTVNVIL